jgi:transcription-repair coupling factor (superfamily II helicase)
VAKHVTKQAAALAWPLTSAWWPWAVAKAWQANPKGCLLVVPPVGVSPAGLVRDVAALLGAGQGGGVVVNFPAWDVQPYDRLGPSGAVVGQRLAVRAALQSGWQGIVVASVPALGVLEAPLSARPVGLQLGDRLDLRKLMTDLVALGYRRVALVDAVGQFAVRGGIVDMWPAAEHLPLRLELFDDEVERLQWFNPADQRGAEPVVGAVQVGPATPAQLDLAGIERFRQQWRSHFAQATEDALYQTISSGQWHPAAGQFLPWFHAAPLELLLGSLPKDTRTLLGPDVVGQTADWGSTVQENYLRRSALPGEAGRALAPELLYAPESVLLGTLQRWPVAEVLQPWPRAHSLPLHNRHAATQQAVQDCVTRVKEGWAVHLTAPSHDALQLMLRALEGEGLPAPHLLEAATDWRAKGLHAVVSGLGQGWVDGAAKQLVLTAGDVFGARMGSGAPANKRRAAGDLLAHFAELRLDDYVVHEDHGIGRFGGLTTLVLDGAAQDFLKLFYADDDRLLVPVENLAVLSRYKGAEGHVSLDKLGTGSWENRKAKVKADLLEMAEELLATAAARALADRPPIGTGAGMYAEFCAGFPHDLTEDQAKAMAEVEHDLSEGAPMDRLVVGDVGFGKTEVALRAAFLVAQQGRQVAVVCPTTLLARQHEALFRERFAGFPMRVAALSRLVPSTVAKQVKAELSIGKVDIVIGTHALLSKELAFSDLGLVVIDEEQRFGVAHKERLKNLRGAVDVLTLTATPIPRTLQLAVGGIRQLSLITTAPVDRSPVQTHLLPWDGPTLQGAIERELARGGQVYVVAPQVSDLPKLEDDLRALVPQMKLGVAHGQMPESQLEAVVGAFYEGSLNVLLATTIIESGLDVPNANTLIVARADRFGLAQLYQLRGRVGRSTRQAFAYVLLPDGGLTPDAARRLEVLQRLDTLGAGFTLASHDMDLRGFGNLLGKQQSGQVRDIGFELYTKLLQEAVRKAQMRPRAAGSAVTAVTAPVAPTGEVPTLRAETVVLKLGVTYLLPETYVPEEPVRLGLYRRLAALTTREEVPAFGLELADRFGPLPPEVEALLEVVQLRNRAAALNLCKIEVGDKAVVLTLAKRRFAEPQKLMAFLQSMQGVWTVRADQALVVHRAVGQGRARLAGVGAMLGQLENLLRPPS